jgi:RND family efflux transporter MFP subunit
VRDRVGYFSLVRKLCAHALAALLMVSIIGPAACTSGGGEGGEQASGPDMAAVVANPIERGSMVVRRRYPGELFSDAVELGSRVGGRIEQVHVRIGDHVDAGQPVAKIDDELLARQLRELRAMLRARRAAARSSEVSASAAQREFDRAQELWQQGATSKQELDTLETELRLREAGSASAIAQAEQAQATIAVLEESLADSEIRAPFAGVVARRDVDPGAFVDAGQSIVRIVAEAPLRVRFRVPEHELGDIHEGLRFELETRMDVAEPPHGEITRLAGEVTPADRSMLIEGVVDPHESLRPGMYADIRLDLRSLEALIIPDVALLERVDVSGDASTGVFRVARDASPGGPRALGGGEAQKTAGEAVADWVEVRVLGREAGRVAIEPLVAHELSDTDEVLVRGHHELGDGAAIRVRSEGG